MKLRLVARAIVSITWASSASWKSSVTIAPGSNVGRAPGCAPGSSSACAGRGAPIAQSASTASRTRAPRAARRMGGCRWFARVDSLRREVLGRLGAIGAPHDHVELRCIRELLEDPRALVRRVDRDAVELGDQVSFLDPDLLEQAARLDPVHLQA